MIFYNLCLQCWSQDTEHQRNSYSGLQMIFFDLYLVEEVRAETGVAAEPLVRTVLTAFNDVSGDHAASVLQWSLPGELH